MKLAEMKITENNSDLFIRLGNIFPSWSDINRCFEFLSPRMITLLGELTNNTYQLQYLSKSYHKKISNLMRILLDSYALDKKPEGYYTFGTNALIYICKLIDNRFFVKWNRLKESTELEYNPINPYSMKITDRTEESITNDINITRNSNITNTSIRNEDTTNKNDTTFSSEDNVVSDKTDNYIYGFNSESPKSSDGSLNSSNTNSKSEDKFNGTINRKNNDTDTNTLSGSTVTDQDKGITTNRTISRDGNIGNITQQELIEKQREILRYQIYDEIFRDLDSVFCCHSY